MIGVGIGYPIGTLISGANRVGTNPPTRPDPIPSVVLEVSCLSVAKTKSNLTVSYAHLDLEPLT